MQIVEPEQQGTVARERGITLTGPLPADTSRQARGGGYTTDMFAIDWDAEQVTCPQGTVSGSWNPCRQYGTGVIVVKFPAPDIDRRRSSGDRWQTSLSATQQKIATEPHDWPVR